MGPPKRNVLVCRRGETILSWIHTYPSPRAHPAGPRESKNASALTLRAALGFCRAADENGALVASASSDLPVSFAIDAGPASVDGNTLTLTGTGAVTVRASQGGDASYAAAANVVRTFTVTASFDFWQLNAFSSAERNDPTMSGPNADPDADGVPNLIEYALGSDARSASAAGVPVVALESGNWSFTYTRPVDRSDLVYSVEQSTDLIHWNTTDVTHIRVSIADGLETWRATYPTASASACFFRLVVTR